MLKKSVIILLLATCCIATAFATRQIRTSLAPYSFQRISTDNRKELSYDTNYGFGIKFAYLRSLKNGVTFGGELGVFDYTLPDHVMYPLGDGKVGGCVHVPMFFKFGYHTPLSKQRKVRYFVYADIGGRVLHAATLVNMNPEVGIDLGVTLNLKQGFNFGIGVEPKWSFSNKTDKDSKEEKHYTDFIVNVSLELGYEF